MSDAAPSQLVADRYRLISPLGQGGMGRVWRARDEVLHRDVAIKELVPPPGLTNDERREMRERSLREARAIARLNNVNVVRIFDVLRTDGDPWIVMEYVASRSLQDTIAEDGPVPAARAVEIGLGVLNALKAAHKAGIMHRDVKPGNVLLGNDGRVVLTDFGLATIPGDPNVTRTGMVLGSPAYISPERARDGTAGPEADLWGLGATLYAAVEGKSPYARSSAIATLAALATEPVPPPRNAGPLKSVLNGLLRKDPQERVTAESAERMLRKAAGRRARSISLLDGVRRPGPNGPREPRPPLVPAPRPSGERPASPVGPPAPRTPPPAGPTTAAAAGARPDPSTGTPAAPDAAPTAKVPADAEPTTRVDVGASGSDGASTEQLAASGDGSEAGPTTRVGDADATTRVSEGQSASTAAGSLAAAGATGSAATADGGDPTATGDAEATRVTRQPTSLLPSAPVSPAPARGSVFTSGFLRSERNRRGLLVGALVAVLLLGLVLVVPLLTGGDGDDGGTPQDAAGNSDASPTATGAPTTSSSAAPPSPSESPSPSASPSPSVSTSPSTPAGGLPEGWTMRTDPVGFKLPIPDGWRRSASGTSVTYREPNGVRELLIDRTDTPKRDAAAEWRRIESGRKNVVRNYEYIDIWSFDCKWRTCADWDWRETRDNTRIRTRNRGFVTASNRGFALRWEVADREWDEQLANFEMIFREFVPDRQD
ncbi:serine/threonine-protein kinase [Micromonospora radicis]|uniref:non-specific serine/threonine protein kinase n=1 Tax=Micromonospora radicis TaxID=1894971 RepID=A0A418MXP8_9ACTN|nr:serine/threonine-protein kinase [Micromonospora radicis]RIV39524.1 serine/threonine protein kinase [Micromonospora radicis]